MKIPINKNKFVLIDPQDFSLITHKKEINPYQKRSVYIWRIKVVRGKEYAIASMKINERWIEIKMHRFILGVTDRNLEVDHIDGNGLNNQRINLRVCTHQQNCFNKKHSPSRSGFRGVKQVGSRWMAYITIDGKQKYLGMFPTAPQAARAYNQSAIQIFGEFACLNQMSS